MGKQSRQVPGYIVSAVICLLVSVGATVIVMLSLGYKTGETVREIMQEAWDKKGTGGGGSAQVSPKGVIEGGNFKAMMAKGLQEPRPVEQVVNLIAKLDALTSDPGTLQLTDEDEATISRALTQLTNDDYLADFVAKQQMDAILRVLGFQRKKLEDAGFKWPSNVYNPNQRPPKNPFKEGEPAQHVKSLTERLAKVKR